MLNFINVEIIRVQFLIHPGPKHSDNNFTLNKVKYSHYSVIESKSQRKDSSYFFFALVRGKPVISLSV